MTDVTVTRITIIDRLPADAANANNGGDYGESRALTPHGELWQVEYRSSYDGDYCRTCGSYSCDGRRCEPEHLTDQQVQDLIDARRAEGVPITLEGRHLAIGPSPS